MTMVGADASLGLLQSQIGHSNLKIGAELVVGVQSLTRHGLLVRLGQEQFLLNPGAAAEGAKNLTLKVTERANNAVHKVQILALDSQRLSKPVQGELTSRQQPAPTVQPASTTITEDHQIEVNVRPVTSDGRYLGPTVAVRLGTVLALAPATGEVVTGQQGSGGSSDTNWVGKPNVESFSSRPGSQSLIQPSSSSQQMTHQESSPSPKAGLALSFPATHHSMSATRQQHLSGTPVGSASPAGVVPGSAGSASQVRASSKLTGSPSAAPVPTDAGSVKAVMLQAAGHLGKGQDVFKATVVGRALDHGQLLLQVTDDLLMKIDEPVDLPIGTALQMTVVTQPVSVAQPLDTHPSMNQTGLLTKLIALLDDIEQSGRSSAEHREPAMVRLPMPDRHLASRLLQLIGFQMGSSFEDLGIPAQDQGNSDFSKTRQLQSLLVDVANTASEPLAEGWRSTTLPMGSDPAQALMIHYREHHLDQDSNGDDVGTDDVSAQRAVFEVNFSRLGRCQIDALCQEQRFDLLLRSEQPLDQEHQQEITALFASACEIAGLTGEIGYSHGQFVEPALTPRSITTVTT